MPLGVNAISLAEKLRTPEDQILELQRHHVLPTSYTCPSCKVTTQKLEVEAKSNYHYFRCAGCKSRTSLRYLFVCYFNMTRFNLCTTPNINSLFVQGRARFSLGRRSRCGLFSWLPTSLWPPVSPTSSSFTRSICLATVANSSWAQAARLAPRLWFYTMEFLGVF